MTSERVIEFIQTVVTGKEHLLMTSWPVLLTMRTAPSNVHGQWHTEENKNLKYLSFREGTRDEDPEALNVPVCWVSSFALNQFRQKDFICPSKNYNPAMNSSTSHHYSTNLMIVELPFYSPEASALCATLPILPTYPTALASNHHAQLFPVLQWAESTKLELLRYRKIFHKLTGYIQRTEPKSLSDALQKY